MTNQITPFRVALQDVARSLAGVKVAPDAVVPAINELPFVIAYLVRSELDLQGRGNSKDIHVFHWEIHLAKSPLPNVLDQQDEIFTLMEEALKTDPTVGGSCDTIVFPLNAYAGALDWAAQRGAHIGVRLEVKAKFHKSLT